MRVRVCEREGGRGRLSSSPARGVQSLRVPARRAGGSGSLPAPGLEQGSSPRSPAGASQRGSPPPQLAPISPAPGSLVGPKPSWIQAARLCWEQPAWPPSRLRVQLRAPHRDPWGKGLGPPRSCSRQEQGQPVPVAGGRGELRSLGRGGPGGGCRRGVSTAAWLRLVQTHLMQPADCGGGTGLLPATDPACTA